MGLVIVDIALANCWFLIAGVAVNGYARFARKADALPNIVHFVALAAPSLLLPLNIFPSQMAPMVGPIGWEFWLSSYSYVHRLKSSASSSVRDGLFFLLVSPMLVFLGPRNRLETPPRLMVFGLARVLGGYLAVCLGLFAQWSLARPATSAGFWAPPLVFVVSQYATHSGRASQDIGLLRLLGYSIPERYHYPLLAKSPQEFWQRWNIYVKDWAVRYLFRPLARSARRRGLSAGPSVALAVVVTFLTIGVLHDVGALWQPTLRGYGFTAWFAVNGLVVLAWRAVVPRMRQRVAARWLAALVRSLFVAVMVAIAWAGLRLIAT